MKNLAEAIGELHEAGFQTIGLDFRRPQPGGRKPSLTKSWRWCWVPRARACVGKRGTVTALAGLDLYSGIRSLDVSNAAAIALSAAEGFCHANSESPK